MWKEMQEYLDKVYKIAWVMYEIDGDILEEYDKTIKTCYERNYTPRRTVEVIATHLFG